MILVSIRHFALLVAFSGSLLAAPLNYKSDVQSIFKKHCYSCHSDEKGKKKAGYVFDNLETLKYDVDAKGIIRPGDPEGSRALEVLKLPEGSDNRMPPDGEGLSKSEIAKVEKWIKEGAFLDAAAAKAGGTPAATPAKPATTATPQQWKNTEGKLITAIFLKLEGEKVHLKMPDGRVYQYPLEKLAAESQAQAKKAAGQ